ncbi:MAG: Sel1 repeat protein [Campylobacteraceae bacterium]|nr:Sel1 repeat protein [Campylobacteraceae bacterium]
MRILGIGKGFVAEDTGSCCNLSVSYHDRQGVKQNKSTAKKYFGKCCELKELGCDKYKELNEQGY